VEEVFSDPTKLLGLETTEFAAEDYQELVQEVKRNGKQFTSMTFEEMVDVVGVQHIKTTIYSRYTHPKATQ